MASIGVVVTGIKEGARLLNALDEAALPIEAAFWLLTAEYSDWRLVLAAPVGEDGTPREMTRRILEVLRSLDDVDYLWDKVTIVGPNDRRVRDLRAALPRGLRKPGYCLGQFYSRELEILDSYVYRVASQPASSMNLDGTASKRRKCISNGANGAPRARDILRLKSEVRATLGESGTVQEVSPRSSG